MKNKYHLTTDDLQLFKESMSKWRNWNKIRLFCIHRLSWAKNRAGKITARTGWCQLLFFWWIPTTVDGEGPDTLCAAHVDHFEVKSCGAVITARYVFDLHGLTQKQAKQELGHWLLPVSGSMCIVPAWCMATASIASKQQTLCGW